MPEFCNLVGGGGFLHATSVAAAMIALQYADNQAKYQNVACLFFLQWTTSELWCLSGGKRGDYQNCSMMFCVLSCAQSLISTLRWAVPTVLWIGFCHTGPISLCTDGKPIGFGWMLYMSESHENMWGPRIVDVTATEVGAGWVGESHGPLVTPHWTHISTLHMLLPVLFTPLHYAAIQK